MAEIVIAEDSPTHAAMIRTLLTRAGHDVRTAVNGREALEEVRKRAPHAVVTDLQMPVMNGLEFVQQLAGEFPNVPAILATAHGSESLAADALAHSAVNFVPKGLAGKLLEPVVRRTLALSEAARCTREIPSQSQHVEFYFKLKSRIAVIEPASVLLMQALSASGVMSPTVRTRISTAVASAIFSAICYCNLELADENSLIDSLLADDAKSDETLVQSFSSSPFLDRIVRFKVSIGSDDTRISISHEGSGRLVRTKPAPGTPASFELEQCRGWLLITSFMDNVILNKDCSEVVMVKNHT